MQEKGCSRLIEMTKLNIFFNRIAIILILIAFVFILNSCKTEKEAEIIVINEDIGGFIYSDYELIESPHDENIKRIFVYYKVPNGSVFEGQKLPLIDIKFSKTEYNEEKIRLKNLNKTNIEGNNIIYNDLKTEEKEDDYVKIDGKFAISFEWISKGEVIIRTASLLPNVDYLPLIKEYLKVYPSDLK